MTPGEEGALAWASASERMASAQKGQAAGTPAALVSTFGVRGKELGGTRGSWVEEGIRPTGGSRSVQFSAGKIASGELLWRGPQFPSP